MKDNLKVYKILRKIALIPYIFVILNGIVGSIKGVQIIEKFPPDYGFAGFIDGVFLSFIYFDDWIPFILFNSFMLICLLTIIITTIIIIVKKNKNKRSQ